eukprot:1762025-Ditylum_brightwellii.AAC.1
MKKANQDAASFVAMADAGGHSVDNYLERNSTYGEVAAPKKTAVVAVAETLPSAIPATITTMAEVMDDEKLNVVEQMEDTMQQEGETVPDVKAKEEEINHVSKEHEEL